MNIDEKEIIAELQRMLMDHICITADGTYSE